MSIKLPVRYDEAGIIVNADGENILHLANWSAMPPSHAKELGQQIVDALNTSQQIADDLSANRQLQSDVTESLCNDLEAVEAKLDSADKWRLALESLTAQGSEFHNDLDRCVAYVRERYEERHEAKKQVAKLRRRIDSAVKVMREAQAVVARVASGPFAGAIHPDLLTVRDSMDQWLKENVDTTEDS